MCALNKMMYIYIALNIIPSKTTHVGYTYYKAQLPAARQTASSSVSGLLLNGRTVGKADEGAGTLVWKQEV